MSYPDFFILGAMKCGTTTLAAQLGRQDGVFMCEPKEPFYFSDDDVYARGPEWYHSLFRAAAPGDLIGEASTRYTMRPTYPHTLARMTQVLSRPRLVYVLRNPVERFVSHYMHQWSERRISVDIVTARERHPELIAYGRYAMQIAPFVEAFGPEAILLSSLERMKADPAGELARVGAHIGMTAPPVWKTDVARLNVSGERFRKLPLHGRITRHPVVRTLRRTLGPTGLEDRIKAARRMPDRPDLPPEVVDAIWEVHRGESADLRRFGLKETDAVLDSLGAP